MRTLLGMMAFLGISSFAFAETKLPFGFTIPDKSSTYKVDAKLAEGWVKPNALLLDFEGTWKGSITHPTQGTIHFTVSFGMFPELGTNWELPVAAGEFVDEGSQTKHYGSAIVAPDYRSIIVFPIIGGKHYSLFLAQEGGTYSGDGHAWGDNATVKAYLKRQNTDHPFHFTKNIIAMNLLPRTLNDEAYFGSPQTAVTNSSVAYTNASEEPLLMKYFQGHFVPRQGGHGEGGTLNLQDALTTPEKGMDADAYFTRLQGNMPFFLVTDWASTAQLVTKKPLVLRFDNATEGIFMTVSEPETPPSF